MMENYMGNRVVLILHLVLEGVRKYIRSRVLID